MVIREHLAKPKYGAGFDFNAWTKNKVMNLG